MSWPGGYGGKFLCLVGAHDLKMGRQSCASVVFGK